MSEPSYEIPAPQKPPEKRLDSWKEIAGYLNRDVTTVQRWEKREGMPVHRHVHDKRGSVYAVPAELDAWIHSRKATAVEPDDVLTSAPANVPLPTPIADDRGPVATPKPRLWLVLAAIICIAV